MIAACFIFAAIIKLIFCDCGAATNEADCLQSFCDDGDAAQACEWIATQNSETTTPQSTSIANDPNL